jgi:hypothetical protein
MPEWKVTEESEVEAGGPVDAAKQAVYLQSKPQRSRRFIVRDRDLEYSGGPGILAWEVDLPCDGGPILCRPMTTRTRARGAT